MDILKDFLKRQTKSFLENIAKEKDVWSKEKIKKQLVHVISPGRVNIIGEHTDYNSGLAIPLAINKYKFFSGIKNDSNTVEIYDNLFKEYYSFNLENISYDTKIKWANYIKGIIKEFILYGYKISGFSMVINSNLLSGSGLSSSAAMLLGTSKLLIELFGLKCDREKILKICHEVENNFVGVNNGMMDHFAVLYGKKNNAIYLNFYNLDWEYIPFELSDNIILVIDSREERYLPDTDYNKRRKECVEVLEVVRKVIGNNDIKSLSDIDSKLLADIEKKLPYRLFKRGRHIVTENDRVKKAKKYILQNNMESLGSILLESHKSLSDDYKVSTERLDFIVDNLSSIEGVYGSRLMGAGFGGTVLSIVNKKRLDEVIYFITKRYRERFDIEPIFIPCNSSDGVKRVLN